MVAGHRVDAPLEFAQRAAAPGAAPAGTLSVYAVGGRFFFKDSANVEHELVLREDSMDRFGTIHTAGHSLMGSGGASEVDRGWGQVLSAMLGGEYYTISKGGAVLAWPERDTTGDGGWARIVNKLSPAALRPLGKNNSASGASLAWSAAITYGLNDIVTSGGNWWSSKKSGNLNNAPAVGTWWAQVAGPLSRGAVKYPPVPRFPILFFGNNDLGWGKQLTPFLEAARYAMSVCSLAEIYDDNWAGLTYGANFAARVAENDQKSFGTGYRTFPSVVGANGRITCYVPIDLPDDAILAFGFVADPAATGTIKITDGLGTNYATKNFAGTTYTTAGANLANGVVMRISVAAWKALGSPPIFVEPSVAPVAGVHFDWFGVESSPATYGAFVKLFKPVDYSIWTAPLPVDADVDTWNAGLQNLIDTEFPTWRGIDPATGWNTKDEQFYTADGVHPNDIGHAKIAEAVFLGLKSFPVVDLERIALQVDATPTNQVRGKHAETINSAGAGTVNIVHNLGTQDIEVAVRRIVHATLPLGKVYLHWVPVDDNTVQVDFDTYARAAGEFRVTVIG